MTEKNSAHGVEESDLEGYEVDEEEEDEEISDATKINSRIRQILGLFTNTATSVTLPLLLLIS